MLLPVPGQAGDAVLSGILADAVATALGRSFRPKHVVFVADLLKTQSMKVMRRMVRAALAGQRLGDLSSLANPQALLICAVNGEGGQA